MFENTKRVERGPWILKALDRTLADTATFNDQEGQTSIDGAKHFLPALRSLDDISAQLHDTCIISTFASLRLTVQPVAD